MCVDEKGDQTTSLHHRVIYSISTAYAAVAVGGWLAVVCVVEQGEHVQRRWRREQPRPVRGEWRYRAGAVLQLQAEHAGGARQAMSRHRRRRHQAKLFRPVSIYYYNSVYRTTPSHRHTHTGWMFPQHVIFKLCMTVYKCLHGLALKHLAESCVPVADVAGRRQLRSASRGLLNYNMSNYGQTVSPVLTSGTHFRSISGNQHQ